MENQIQNFSFDFFDDLNITQDENDEWSLTVRVHNLMDFILIVYSVFIILFGTLFNLLNFGCFYRMKKRNSQNIYLGALSLTDLFNIQINILVPILNRWADSKDFSLKEFLERQSVHWLDKDISDDLYDLICKLNGYFVEIGLLMPVWIMVILSMERFFSIMWPLKQNIFSTRKHAKVTLFLLTLSVSTWSLFKFKTAGVERYSTFERVPQLTGRNVTLPTLVNISTTLWAIVPEFLTLILNLMIIKQIKITTSPHKKFYPSEHSKKITQATRVVVLLSIIFITLISPTGILIILDLIINIDKEGAVSKFSVKRALAFMSARKFVIMFYETNLIINFPIYLLTIKNFKETLENFVPGMKLLNRKDSTKIGIKKKRNFKSNKCIKNLISDLDLNNNKNNLNNQPNTKGLKNKLTNKKFSISSSNSLFGDGCKLSITFHNGCPTCIKQPNKLADTPPKEDYKKKTYPILKHNRVSRKSVFSNKFSTFFSNTTNLTFLSVNNKDAKQKTNKQSNKQDVKQHYVKIQHNNKKIINEIISKKPTTHLSEKNIGNANMPIHSRF